MTIENLAHSPFRCPLCRQMRDSYDAAMKCMDAHPKPEHNPDRLYPWFGRAATWIEDVAKQSTDVVDAEFPEVPDERVLEWAKLCRERTEAQADARLARESLFIAKRDVENLETELRLRNEAIRNATSIIDEYQREAHNLRAENERLRRLLRREDEPYREPKKPLFRWSPPL